ncbi:MAG: SagB family peptide dehydrogenase [Candidatus Hodarchaeales archaeon]
MAGVILKKQLTVNNLKMVVFITVLFLSSLLLLLELLPATINGNLLPDPDKVGDIPLITAIQQFKPAINLDHVIIDNRTIGQLAWALQGITHGPGFRTVPSAGATYPLDIFIFINGSTEVNDGVYRYKPETHRIEIITRNPDPFFLLTAVEENNALLANAGAIFVIFADYSRTTDRYGQRGVRYVHLESGHAMQNFYLQAHSLGLGTRAITVFKESNIQNFFSSTLTPLVLLPVGEAAGESSLDRYIMHKTVDSTPHDQITVERALASRSSVRDYVEGNVDNAVLENIINTSLMITSTISGNTGTVIELRVVTGEVSDLPAGKYHYRDGTFYRFDNGDFRADLQEISLDQPWVGNAQLDIAISVNTSLPAVYNDSVLYTRLLLMDVGMVAQNVYHMCMIHGLGTVVIGAFNDSEVSTFLEIPVNHEPVYIMPVGLTMVYSEIGKGTSSESFRRMVGFFMFIPGYVVLFMTIPSLRSRFSRRLRLILHCGIAVSSVLFLLLHYMLIHGIIDSVFGLISPVIYLKAALGLLKDMMQIPSSINGAGYYAANVAMVFFLVSSVIGIVLLKKGFHYRRYLKRIHGIILYIVLILACFHCIVNRSVVITNPVTFILANIIIMDTYLIVKNANVFSWKNRVTTKSN